MGINTGYEIKKKIYKFIEINVIRSCLKTTYKIVNTNFHIISIDMVKVFLQVHQKLGQLSYLNTRVKKCWMQNQLGKV